MVHSSGGILVLLSWVCLSSLYDKKWSWGIMSSHYESVLFIHSVRDSFVRAITYSFGSICFGSLIVAIIQAAKEMVRQMRENGDGMLMCCAEFLLGCIEWLVEYFNKWAFVYVGLYGYSFMTAGTNVMTLFRSRGWTTIITDNLIDNVLTMVSVGVGVLTGVLSILVASVFGFQQFGAAPFV